MVAPVEPDERGEGADIREREAIAREVALVREDVVSVVEYVRSKGSVLDVLSASELYDRSRTLNGASDG